MLLSFRFSNHRSFADEQQLNLTPVYEGDSAAVPVVGIFGPNASGKSNALKALTYLKQLVLRSDRDSEPGGGIRTEPFRLGGAGERTPSNYVVDLLLDGVRYAYGVRLDSEQVLEEWLYSYPHNRRRKIFERRGSGYSYGEESGQTSIEQVERVTAANVLFLSTTARFDQDAVQPVYQWFRSLRQSERGEWPDLFGPVDLIRGLQQHVGRRHALTELLKAADTGIHNIVIESAAASADHVSRAGLGASGRPSADEGGGSNIDALVISMLAATLALRSVDRSGSQSRLRFAHASIDGPVMFDIEDESAGTVQLLYAADRALDAISSGGTLLIDEIDASLHPLLTAKLIGLFQSPDTNPRNAQLIFTSHDATLLGTLDGTEVLRRDEVWFVEKDQETGASSLFPLSDFKPRKEENRQRRYLNGSYGAIPDASWEMFASAVQGRGSADVTETVQ